MNRRSFLKISGTSIVVLAAAAGGYVATRTPTDAIRPWATAGEGYRDPRLHALSYAILAPNPHNRQPWVVSLAGDDAFDLHCDLDRRLPETDPYDRQITIGLGCFLELARMGAAERGLDAVFDLFPEGEPQPRLDRRPVARVTFRRNGAAADPLFAHVLDRRSNKEPYDTSRAVPDAALETILAAVSPSSALTVDATNAPRRVADFRELTWGAHLVEVGTPRTYRESIRLMRIGKAEIEASPDGIDIGGALPDALKTVGLFTRETLADPGSVAFRQGLDLYESIMKSAMAHTWIVTGANTRTDQIEAGRAWVRMNLAAAGLGLGLHPLSQSLQEFPEMDRLYRIVHRRLGVTAPARVQMLGRLGFGPTVGPSPRWPLETRVSKA